MGGKLLLITNSKSHMGFRLVPNSVTLNDLERRNRPNGCVISLNSVAFLADCVKMVEDTRILFAAKMWTKKSSFRRYWQGITPSESVKVRHYPLASENWTITWKRCKIGGKLLLITYRKSYMSFRLVPKSVTLNDLERRNGCYIALFY